MYALSMLMEDNCANILANLMMIYKQRIHEIGRVVSEFIRYLGT